MRWFVGAFVLLLVGLWFRLGLLVYAMYALLATLLISRYLAREWIENLSATRECNRLTAQIGEKVAVVVTIKNEGALPVAWLLFEDSLPRDALYNRPARIRVEGKRMMLSQLRPHGQTTLLYQVDFVMRGYYQIGPLLLESGDLFGLHRRYKVVTEPHFILVYPKVVPLQGYDLASRRPIGEVKLTHRLFEDPTRIAGVRRYQHGDSLNRVHWRATARTGELHSKVYEPSTVAGATLLLDFHRGSYPARSEPNGSELAVTSVASLANTVYQMGQQVGLITNGRDAADRVRQEGWKLEFRTRAAARRQIGMQVSSDRLRPVTIETRRGADQLMRILEMLARLELSDGLTFPQLIMETASRMPRDATVVAVLSNVSQETAVALGSLRRRGFAVTAILVVFDDSLYPDNAGRLMSESIDVRRVENESMLSDVCSAQLV